MVAEDQEGLSARCLQERLLLAPLAVAAEGYLRLLELMIYFQ